MGTNFISVLIFTPRPGLDSNNKSLNKSFWIFFTGKLYQTKVELDKWLTNVMNRENYLKGNGKVVELICICMYIRIPVYMDVCVRVYIVCVCVHVYRHIT